MVCSTRQRTVHQPIIRAADVCASASGLIPQQHSAKQTFCASQNGCDCKQLAAMNRTRYSVFTKWQKRWVVFLVAVAGWFSTLSSFIFFPAIPTLARVLHTSVGRINLTVTSYLLVAAVAPTFIGHFADRSGRRPVYLICLTVYLISNISLACQTSFAALFTLRMLQSAGISGTICDTTL